MNNKKIISMITAAMLAFNSIEFCISSYALDENEIQYVSEFSEQVSVILEYEDMGNVICTKELYDSDDALVAYCIETENGYIIYDINGEVIEYSPTKDSPYKNINGKLYYSGLFGYYVNEGDTYENIYDSTTVDDVNFKHISSAEELALNNIGTTRSIPTVLSGQINYEPREINYNVNGLNACGTMATTIIFLYYYDHICSSFANPLLSGTPFYMFEDLRQEIEPDTYGTTPTQLRNGILNNFKHVTTLTEINFYYCNNTSNISPVNIYKSLIEYFKIPCWLLTLTYEYGPHWVVGYGYTKIITSTSEAKFFIVNDGHCNNNVKINENDVDYMMYIKSYKTYY